MVASHPIRRKMRKLLGSKCHHSAHTCASGARGSNVGLDRIFQLRADALVDLQAIRTADSDLQLAHAAHQLRLADHQAIRADAAECSTDLHSNAVNILRPAAQGTSVTDITQTPIHKIFEQNMLAEAYACADWIKLRSPTTMSRPLDSCHFKEGCLHERRSRCT